MEARVDEIAPQIFRIAVWTGKAPSMVNRRRLWNRWRLALALAVSLGVIAPRGYAQTCLAQQAPAEGPATATPVGGTHPR
jgi:hypothetical protein